MVRDDATSDAGRDRRAASGRRAEPARPARLLWRDDRLLVLDKPPGLSLQTPPRAPQAAVERLIAALEPAARADLEPLGPLLLVHRLDVGTSGVVAIARDPAMHRELTAAFAERRVEKVYWALVWGRPRPSAGVFDEPLGPDRADRRRMRVDRSPAARPARSAYRVLAASRHRPVAWVELRPETGRTHQLRVHLAAAGHPIVGDDLYGGPRHRGVREPALRRLLDPPHALLHAVRLTLPAPPLAERRTFTAEPPSAFAAALAACGFAAERPGDGPLDPPPDAAAR